MDTEDLRPAEAVLSGDASVDIRGRDVDKTKKGGWKAAWYILATEGAERLAFYSVASNLVTYLSFELHEPIPRAANIVTNWLGADYVLGILGAFIADSYWGRYYTIAIFTCFYVVGMILITLSATVRSLRPPSCNVLTSICEPAASHQLNFLLAGLYIISLGTGGIKPCVSAFGADQFDDSDDHDRRSKHSFFNWFYFSINVGALIAITVFVYIQENIGWGLGYGIPAAFMAVSLGLLLLGTPRYRHKLPSGSPYTRFVQVLIAALRNWRVDVPSNEEQLYEVTGSKASAIAGARKLKHTKHFRFLDKAAISTTVAATVDHSPWRLCTVTQVEELKLFVKILPIIGTTMFLWTGYAQMETFFVQQGTSLDRRLGPHFQIPAASLPIFAILNAILILPVYDRIVVPLVRELTGDDRGLTPLRRVGVGLFFSIMSMVSAALVERRRLNIVRDYGLLDNREATVPMSIFWLAPQYFLGGTAEIFVYVGQLEFFYDEVSDAMRSVSTALFLSELGLGSWTSSVLVSVVRGVTGKEDGWIVNNLNRSRLDKFYWLLAVVSAANLVIYVVYASVYCYKKLPPKAIANVESDECNTSIYILLDV